MTGILLVLAATATAAPDILPEPQVSTINFDESFIWSSRIPLVLADDISDELRIAVEAFLNDVGLRANTVRASRHRHGDPAVYIGVFDRHASFDNRRVERMVSGMSEPGPQGYRLSVSSRGIALAGTDVQGARFGLETLKQLMGPRGRFPYARIQDSPDVPSRGVYAEEPLSADDLKRLVALKCNSVLYASDAFLDLSGESGRRWAEAFAEARRLGLEPIPVLNLLGGAAPLLRRDGRAAEGRIAEDRLILPQSAWVALARPNTIAGPDSPIRVSVSGIGCEEGVDYEIQPGRTAYPFRATDFPWKIRRVPGGAIPDGATVDVRYAYVPENTAAMCPYAKATLRLWRDTLETVRDRLKPRTIHLGLSRPARLRADLRCEARASSDLDAFAHAVKSAIGIVKSVDSEWKVMAWADAFLGVTRDGAPRIGGAMGALPAEVGLVVRGRAVELAQSLMATAGVGNRLYFLASGSAPETYAMIESISPETRPGAGVFVSWPGQDSLEMAMNKAWSLESPRLPWPHRLNAYFGSNLWEPGYEESLAAMVEYLNGRFVRGHSPKKERDTFDDALREVERALPRNALDGKALRRQFGQLIEYAELEAAFTNEPRDTYLSRVIGLVEDVAEDHPGYDEQRTATIIQTIRSQRLLVPATILFGAQLLPYREYALPPNTDLLPIPAAPIYRDSQSEPQATIDTLGAVAPIYRIDFDAIGAASVLIEERGDGGAFRSVQHVTDLSGAGVRAPILMNDPFLSPSIRINVKAAGARAALRDVRIFGLKPAPRVVARRAISSVHIDGELDEEAWDGPPEVYGFVAREGGHFAESPTTVRVRATRDAILVGATMHDRRMRTMAAHYAGHDEPLWEGESFEVWIRTPLGAVYRFAINPNGATYDSKDGDAGWDGAWRGAVKVNESDWSAEIELPLKLFAGSSPGRGRWGVDFRRTRANVVREQSTWAAVGELPLARVRESLGMLVFEGR